MVDKFLSVNIIHATNLSMRYYVQFLLMLMFLFRLSDAVCFADMKGIRLAKDTCSTGFDFACPGLMSHNS